MTNQEFTKAAEMNLDELLKKTLKKNFMAPLYGWGSTVSRLEPLRGGSLLLTTKFPIKVKQQKNTQTQTHTHTRIHTKFT